jgi:hypothetical protein
VAVSGVVHLQDGQPAAVIYLFGHLFGRLWKLASAADATDNEEEIAGGQTVNAAQTVETENAVARVVGVRPVTHRVSTGVVRRLYNHLGMSLRPFHGGPLWGIESSGVAAPNNTNPWIPH